MRPWFPLAVAALLAGCAGTTPAVEVPDPSLPQTADRYAEARALAAGLPCEADAAGTATSANLLPLGNGTFPDAGVGDFDIRGHLLAANAGILDITDPLRPRLVSDFLAAEIPSGGDAKWMPDNRTVVVGGGAVTLVDVSDLANPRAEASWDLSEGGAVPGLPQLFLNAHMLYAARIGGEDWVFVAPNSNHGVWILRAEGEWPERRLEYVAQTLPVEGGPLGPHDMFVHQDPFTGTWLLYAADGFHGWIVYDVDDPANPMPVGGHVRPETGYTHTIQAADVGGRRIVATIQEVGVNLLEVYDATNLLAPVLLGTWQVAPAATTPQHNLNIVNGTLYVAHYGHGMYAFDLRALGVLPASQVARMEPVAHYDPQPGGDAYVLGIGGFEALYDVVVHDGLVYVGGFSEPVLGIHVLAYGCNAIGDPALRSVG